MIVVSDNGPVAFLVQIGRSGLLSRLYDTVLVPHAVLTEFRRLGTPESVRSWAERPPDWIVVKAPRTPVDDRRMGYGEREAIQLAKEEGAFLLCDDRAAINAARRAGLVVTGTLGILQVAHAREWIEIGVVLRELRDGTEFRFPSPERLDGIVSEAEAMRRLFSVGAVEPPAPQ